MKVSEVSGSFTTKEIGAKKAFCPLPRVPWGSLEISRAPGLLAAPPRFQKAPAPPAQTHLQGSTGSFGPRAAKCVTTHF